MNQDGGPVRVTRSQAACQYASKATFQRWDVQAIQTATPISEAANPALTHFDWR